MAAKEVAPALALASFSCPHCGALAAQSWFRIFPKGFTGNARPFALSPPELNVLKQKQTDPSDVKRYEAAIVRLLKNSVTYIGDSSLPDAQWEMINLHLSRCFACDGFAIWTKGSLTWPVGTSTTISAHEDMPADVKADFDEAAGIVDRSPRGAAALLRLALQKLMVDLGEKGKNINDDIASLVSKGLEVDIQRALDFVRVVGNSSVHPGQIDLRDDPATARALFSLVNLVVDRRIAASKRLEEMYKTLPPGALDQIQKRDGQ